MLEHLKVLNVALIEEAAIDFTPGLNILTGETGAGKSILIDSLNFVLGAKVGADFVRAGADAASVEAFLTINRATVQKQLADLDIHIAEDNALLIFRSLTSAGKSSVKINGRNVTISMLRDVAALLIDVHGQHEHQSLLNPAKHIQLLDRFCHDALAPKIANLATHIASYRAVQKDINALNDPDDTADARAEIYKFQLSEIGAANLSVEEEATLLARRQVLSNAEKIGNMAAAATNLLNGDGGVIDNLSHATEHAASLADLDDTRKAPAAELNSLYAQLADMARDFARYAENLEHNQTELEETEARLDQIYKLRQKYGRDTAGLLQLIEELQAKLDTIENSREALLRLAADKKAVEKEIGRTCLEMSKIRREAAGRLEAQIESALHDLGMEAARFTIEITSKSEFGRNGFDQVRFLISANKGEDVKPLSAIASGGEMSRVMLALKTALAGFDTIETFIFDEIDAGISGRTAQQVAQKMSKIARDHQILCITHLPQIAAMGDTNFHIEKTPQDGRTVTHINKLASDGVIDTLSRLIGGAEITATTAKAAKEMRKMAKEFKAAKN